MAKRKVDVTVTKTVIKKHHSIPMPKTRPKRAHKKRNSPMNYQSKQTLEEQTIRSLIEMQKVHVNLAEKFDKLSVQIENLLALFELAARNFARQPSMQSTEKDKEFLDKIDKLLDQNKVLAKGLTLMEEKMRERVYGVPSPNMVSGLPSRTQIPRQSNDQMRPSISSSDLEEI